MHIETTENINNKKVLKIIDVISGVSCSNEIYEEFLQHETSVTVDVNKLLIFFNNPEIFR